MRKKMMEEEKPQYRRVLARIYAEDLGKACGGTFCDCDTGSPISEAATSELFPDPREI